MSRPKSLAPARGAVESLLRSSELAQALRPHLAKARWAEIVGPQVAAVTQVEAVRGEGILVVRVKNSVWANELALLKDDMLRRLNASLGGKVLSDIHFKASGLARAPKKNIILSIPAPKPDDLARILLSQEVRARIGATVEAIMDDAFRERIRQTLVRAARLEIWKQQQGWIPCARCGALAPLAAVPAPDAPLLCSLCRAWVPASSTTLR